MTLDAFDADVLIYAAVPGHKLGRRVASLLGEAPLEPDGPARGVGSVLLLPELLSRPLRDGATEEVDALLAILARLALHPLDEATARLAVALGASYGLRAADATHLATAVSIGANRFVTNNRRDFPSSISEIDVTYPDALPDPSGHG